MRVSEVMTNPVMTCPAGSTLNAAARLMWEHDIGALPIVDFEGRLTGIATDRDISMAAYTQGKRLDEILVDTAMAKDVLVCHMNDSVDALEELMQRGQVPADRRFVDNDRRPVGIVALNDLARLAARARKSATDRELIATIAAVCEPRVPLERIQMNRPPSLRSWRPERAFCRGGFKSRDVARWSVSASCGALNRSGPDHEVLGAGGRLRHDRQKGSAPSASVGAEKLTECARVFTSRFWVHTSHVRLPGFSQL